MFGEIARFLLNTVFTLFGAALMAVETAARVGAKVSRVKLLSPKTGHLRSFNAFKRPTLPGISPGIIS